LPCRVIVHGALMFLCRATAPGAAVLGNGRHPAPSCPGLPRQTGWRGRHTLPCQRAWRGNPDGSQKQKFPSGFRCPLNSTHLQKPIWGHFPCTKHNFIQSVYIQT
jgi:hypothetical protein